MLAGLAAHASITPLVGDDNRGWLDGHRAGREAFIPVAFSWGRRDVERSHPAVGEPPAVGGAGRREALADFNNDGASDIALTGASGWTSIPVAFAAGNGSVTITNAGVPSFGAWAATPGARPLAGDFNRDGRVDIALAGGAGWSTIRSRSTSETATSRSSIPACRASART